MLKITEDVKRMIIGFEGLDQPSEWPGGESGITIGIGYDLGYMTVDQFESDWGDHLTDDQIKRLKAAVGKHGKDAKDIASQLKDIKIRKADAEKVFSEKTIPLYSLRTEQAFPGIADLPPNVQGAMLSLVYNRGTSMVGDRRAEMRAIRTAIATKNIKEIALQLRKMKKLWENQGLDGLLKRREDEALLVESCIPKS